MRLARIRLRWVSLRFLLTFLYLFYVGYAIARASGMESGKKHVIPASVREKTMSIATWLDEGETSAGLLTLWNETKTFCLYENATFRIRLDPLNSAMQPFPIRRLAQSPEALAVYDFTVATLESLQAYAWPFRAFLKTWSVVRVVIQAQELEGLIYHYEPAPGPVCGTFLSIGRSLWPSFHPYLPSFMVSMLQMSLEGLTHACDWYHQGSLIQCLPLVNKGLKECFIVLENPSSMPCLSITSPSSTFYSTLPSIYTFQLTFYSVMSSSYFLNTVIGLILFYSASSLARSRTFHYLLGACAGITFSLAIAFYLLRKQSKAMSKLVPGFQFVQTIGTLFSLIVPFTGFVLLPSLYQFMDKCWSIIVWIWTSESIFGLPHVGKIYFLLFGLVGCLLVWWNQWGVTPMDHELQQNDAEIEEIGCLDDEDYPLTMSQTILAWGLQGIGLLFLYHGTSSSSTSFVLVLLVVLTGVFESLATMGYYWYYYEAPGLHTTAPLLTRHEYAEQGKTETEKALAALQAYLVIHPEALEVVKEENEIRLRRFAKGRDHLDVATRDSMMQQEQNKKRTSWLWRW